MPVWFDIKKIFPHEQLDIIQKTRLAQIIHELMSTSTEWKGLLFGIKNPAAGTHILKNMV